MYLIAKESEKILIYAYKHMDIFFKVSLIFEDFKKEMNFEYTYNDFIKSFNYLINSKQISGSEIHKEIVRPNEFTLKPITFPKIEEILQITEISD